MGDPLVGEFKGRCETCERADADYVAALVERLEQAEAVVQAARPFADGASCLDEDCGHKVCLLNKALAAHPPEEPAG